VLPPGGVDSKHADVSTGGGAAVEEFLVDLAHNDPDRIVADVGENAELRTVVGEVSIC